MKSFAGDNAGLIFQELAKELNRSIVKNVSPQDTRRVIADVRGLPVFGRNAPTFHTSLVKEREKSRAKRNHTEEKGLNKTINVLEMQNFGFFMPELLRSWTLSTMPV